MFRTIIRLVFKQVPQVFAGEEAEQVTPAWRVHRQLKIDECRPSGCENQAVGFLREVIVGDIVTVHLSEQAQRFPVIAALCGAGFLHG